MFSSHPVQSTILPIIHSCHVRCGTKRNNDRQSHHHHRTKRAASDNAGAPKPRRTKVASDEPPKTVFSHDLRPPPCTGPQLRILSWNVAGLRALLKKQPHALQSLVTAQQADVLCIQEHKLQQQHVPEVQATLANVLPGWTSTFSCCTAEGRKGQSGVAILTRSGYGLFEIVVIVQNSIRHLVRVVPQATPQPPTGPLATDDEGRVLVAEFPLFYLVCAYVPNSGKAVDGLPGSGLKRLQYRTNADDGWDGKLAATLKVCCLGVLLWWYNWRGGVVELCCSC